MATPEELEVKIAELTDSMKAMDESNKGLKSDLTKAKAELRKGQEINPAEFAQLQQDYDTLQAKNITLDGQLKKVTGERDNLSQTLEAENKIAVERQRDSDLTNALTAMNVNNPINLRAAKAILAAQVQVVTEGDKRISKVGDKPLADHLAEWGATDEGKHFISAQQNNGGGSNGGDANPSNKKFSEHTGAELKALREKSPDEYQRLKEAEQP